jgi:acyl carrier protein
MDKAVSFHRFKEMIAHNLGVDIKGLTRDTSFLDDLGIDSLSLINFIITLEKTYDIRIEMDMIWTLKNIGGAYDMFIQKLHSIESSGIETIEMNNMKRGLTYYG